MEEDTNAGNLQLQHSVQLRELLELRWFKMDVVEAIYRNRDRSANAEASPVVIQCCN